MKSMRAYMPALLLGLITLTTGTSVAQNSRMSFTGDLGWYNPCISGHAVIGPGTTYLDYHQNGSHVAIHIRYRGTAQDYDLNGWVATGQDYKVNLEANGHFDSAAVPDQYPVHFHSIWVGHGSAPDFTMDGTINVYMDKTTGLPTGTGVSTDGLTTACVNAHAEGDEDEREHHHHED